MQEGRARCSLIPEHHYHEVNEALHQYSAPMVGSLCKSATAEAPGDAALSWAAAGVRT